MGSDTRPTAADIQAAAARLRGLVWHTPLVYSDWLSDLVRAEVWFKLELVQTTGSFKLRGALNALAALVDRGLRTTAVVSASAGNHGLAVAWGARRLGMDARVHLPASAPRAKREALERLGARLADAPSYEAAEAQAREDARTSGAPYVSPYDNDDVIAGAGTVALEMLADRPDLEALVVPLGGGGLLAGTAIAAKTATKTSRPGGVPSIIGAEAEASPVFSASLAAGRIVRVNVQPTLADGLAGNMDLSSRTFPLVRDLADRVAIVAEDSIRIAMRGLFERERLVVEGAGAAGVGALLQGGLDLAGRRVGVVLTGRNVDAEVFRVVCRTG